MLHAPVVIAADYAGTFEVGDTSELRARLTSQAAAGQPGQSGIDVYTQPRLRMRVVTRDGWAFIVGNAPIFTWDDIELGACSGCFTFYDTGNASVGWHDRTVSVTLSEDASGGLYNIAAGPLPQAMPMPGQMQMPAQGPPAMPPSQQLVPNQTTFVSSEATHTVLALQAQLNRVESLSLGVSYLTNGGVDAAAQRYFPEQYGPRADASFTYALSRRDQAITLAYAFATQFTPAQCYDSTTGAVIPVGLCNPAAQMAQVSEGIRHAVDRETTLSADAGISGSRSRSTDGVPYDERLYPNADVEITRRFGVHGKSSFLLGASLMPVLDWRTGIVNERLQGHIALTDALTELVSFHATVDGSQTVPTDAPLAASVLSGLAEVTYQSSRTVMFAGGARAWWQQQAPFGAYSLFLFYFDVTVLAPALRF